MKYLVSDPTVKANIRFINAMNKLRDDCYFYLVLSKSGKTEGLEIPERTHVLYLDEQDYDGRIMYDMHCSLPIEFPRNFNIRYGKYPVDIWTTSRTTVSSVLKRELWDYRLIQSVPVVLSENMVVTPPKSMNRRDMDYRCALMARTVPVATYYEDMLLRSTAYATCHTLFPTELPKKEALETAKMFLSAKGLEMLHEKTRVQTKGLDFDHVDKTIPYGMPKNKTFTLFYGGRLNEAHGADKMIQLYDEMYQAGRDVKIILTTPKHDCTFLENELILKGRKSGGSHDPDRHIDFYPGCPPHEFYAKAAGSHVFLEMSRQAGFAGGILEQLYMSKYGLVPILPNVPWAWELVPDDYVFLFKNDNEARSMLRWVYENYDEAVSKSKYISKYVYDKFSMKVNLPKYYAILEEIFEEFDAYKRLYSEGNVNLMQEAVDRLRTPFSLDEFFKLVVMFSRDSKFKPIRGKVSRYIAYRWLLEEGGMKDTCDTPIPTFVRA